MKTIPYALLLCLVLLNSIRLLAQENTPPCKVEMLTLSGKYTGECKNGLANGKGEAAGVHRYVGTFKNGLPNDKGIYYFNDSVFYSGNFQDGVKEGKGESHYLRAGFPDSIVSGFWSADDYRGKQYSTYHFTTTQNF
jgi:hypothetical protein